MCLNRPSDTSGAIQRPPTSIYLPHGTGNPMYFKPRQTKWLLIRHRVTQKRKWEVPDVLCVRKAAICSKGKFHRPLLAKDVHDTRTGHTAQPHIHFGEVDMILNLIWTSEHIQRDKTTKNSPAMTRARPRMDLRVERARDELERATPASRTTRYIRVDLQPRIPASRRLSRPSDYRVY